jgi:hypothetical protein
MKTFFMPFALSLSKGKRSCFDKPVLSDALFPFDKLRANGVEGLSTNGTLFYHVDSGLAL